MQRILISIALLIPLILFFSCADKKGSQEIRASGTNVVIQQDTITGSEPGAKLSWVTKGTECYGIVVGYFADGSTLGKSVKCRVVAIKPDKIKMKTVESISLLEGEKCDKMGLAYGDTWWEEEGDIYKTREEAEAVIAQRGWSRQ